MPSPRLDRTLPRASDSRRALGWASPRSSSAQVRCPAPHCAAEEGAAGPARAGLRLVRLVDNSIDGGPVLRLLRPPPGPLALPGRGLVRQRRGLDHARGREEGLDRAVAELPRQAAGGHRQTDTEILPEGGGVTTLQMEMLDRSRVLRCAGVLFDSNVTRADDPASEQRLVKFSERFISRPGSGEIWLPRALVRAGGRQRRSVNLEGRARWLWRSERLVRNTSPLLSRAHRHRARQRLSRGLDGHPPSLPPTTSGRPPRAEDLRDVSDSLRAEATGRRCPLPVRPAVRLELRHRPMAGNHAVPLSTALPDGSG